MKLNFYNIILSLGLSVIASTAFSAASAQDAQYPTFENYSDSTLIDKDKILVALGEPEPRNKVPKDSLTGAAKSQASRVRLTEKTAVTKSEQENENKEEAEDDSILSFNFLYYIFQKYKLQDIVD